GFGSSTIRDVANDQSGMWVAVGDSGKLATSLDGEIWTQQTSSFGTTAIYGIAHDLYDFVENSINYIKRIDKQSDWYLEIGGLGLDGFQLFHPPAQPGGIWPCGGLIETPLSSDKIITSTDIDTSTNSDCYELVTPFLDKIVEDVGINSEKYKAHTNYWGEYR
ncbi:hypothetical protein LCGC14_0886920, partial [marine sediment metagenome]